MGEKKRLEGLTHEIETCYNYFDYAELKNITNR
jgi:hypothetical protein